MYRTLREHRTPTVPYRKPAFKRDFLKHTLPILGRNPSAEDVQSAWTTFLRELWMEGEISIRERAGWTREGYHGKDTK